MFSIKKKGRRRGRKKKVMYQLGYRSYSSNVRMNGSSRRNRSREKPRLPVFRNLRDSPQQMNQESIFASLAKKHKKKPDVPVVSLDDDESNLHYSDSTNVVDMDISASPYAQDEEIFIISDTEEGEIRDADNVPKKNERVPKEADEISIEAYDTRSSSKESSFGHVDRNASGEMSSISGSEPEIIELSDSDEESADEVLVVKEVVSPPGDMTSSTRVNFKKAKYCEPSQDTGFSIGCFKKFKIHPRLWRVAQDLPIGEKSSNIRICSYNVLCQLTIGTTQHLYKHARTNPLVLLWERRWDLLRKELENINADVFCFQEVQYDHFSSCFNPFLTSLGYGGFYKRKTGQCVDGCAVFFKKSVFKSVRYRIVEYFVKEESSMDKPQIAQLLRLRCLKNDQDVVIANTHILFNNQRGDIKIGQLALLFANIDDEMKHGPAPLILMGDFNMEAHSYTYKFITESLLFLKGLPRNELSGQGKKGGPTVDADQILPPECNVLRDSQFGAVGERSIPKDTFTHPLQLASVYNHVNSNNLRDISTAHVENANPDFIFYSIKRKARSSKGSQIFEDPKLRLLKYLTLPDAEVIKTTLGPWPNKHVPSDHIPVIAEFLLSAD